MTLRRAALAGLLALLCWQAAVGIGSETHRLRLTTLAARRAALSPAADWRYRASLGTGAAWLEISRPHLREGQTLVLVHDGSDKAARVTAGFTTLLFPLAVRSYPWSPEEPVKLLGRAGDVVVAHLGQRDRFTDSVVAEGFVPLAQRDDFQLLGPPPGVLPLEATNDRMFGHSFAPPPAPDARRLSGGSLAQLVALPLLLGALVLRGLRLGPRTEPLAFWGWAWMVGCLLVGLALFAWLLAGLPLSALTPGVLGGFAAAAAAVNVVLLARGAHRGRPGDAASRDREDASRRPAGEPARGARWERMLFALCVGLALAVVLDRIVLASGDVITAGDEAAIWSAKAKALWAADGLGTRFANVAHAETGIVHQDYPLLDPLLQVFAFALAGRPLDFENRLPVQLCVLALLLVAAGALRRHAGPSLAALLLLLLATARQTGVAAGDACADAMVALGLLAALDAAERWRTSGEQRWFVLGALALAFLVCSKNEGLMLALVAVAALLATGAVRDARAAAASADARASAARLLPWLLLPLGLAAAGMAFNAAFGFENDLLASAGGVSMVERIVRECPARLLPLVAHVGGFLLRVGVETHLCFAAGLALLLLFPGQLLRRDIAGHRPPYAAVPLALLVALAGYLAIYLSFEGALPQWDQWLRNSLPRVLYHLTPALVVWLGATLARLAGSGVPAPEAAPRA